MPRQSHSVKHQKMLQVLQHFRIIFQGTRRNSPHARATPISDSWRQS